MVFVSAGKDETRMRAHFSGGPWADMGGEGALSGIEGGLKMAEHQ